MKEKNRALQQIHLAVFLFGLAGLIGKTILLPAPLIVFGRVLFASGTLATFMRASHQTLRLDSRRDALLLASLGFILSLHWTAFFHSIRISTVAVGLLGYSTFPVFAALIEAVLSHEKPKIRDMVIAFAAFLGAAALVPSLAIGNNITRGLLWAIVSGLLFALLSIFNGRYVRKYSGLVVAFYEDAAAAIFLLPAVVLIEFHPRLKDVLLLIFLGAVSTALAHSFFISGLKFVRVRTASVIASLEPVYGILFALLFLGEIPSFRTLLGGILILAAAVLATLSKEEEISVSHLGNHEGHAPPD